MRRAIIHFGMPKTGTSSIQDSLFSTAELDLEYLNFGKPNSSGAVINMFSIHPEFHARSIKLGLSVEDVNRLGQKHLDSLRRQLRTSSKELFVLSAECIYHMKECELRALRDEFAAHVDAVHAVGYIRSPVSYAESAFQQQVKYNFTKELDFTKLLPRYALKLSKFDSVFGKDNVTLRLFDPERFLDKSIVKDFCRYMEVEGFDPKREVRSNEALSQQATALLFAFNRYCGEITPSQTSMRRRRQLVASLSELSGPKLRFRGKKLEQCLDGFRRDLQWIQERMGISFPYEAKNDKSGITCEEDMFVYSTQTINWLIKRSQVAKSEVGVPSPQDVAELVSTLH